MSRVIGAGWWLVVASLGGLGGACVPMAAAATGVRPHATTFAHRSKPLKTLPATQAKAPTVAVGHGPVSPYARAAALRDATGEPPPGHPRVRPPTAPAAAPTP